jgi:hypothetical protein
MTSLDRAVLRMAFTRHRLLPLAAAIGISMGGAVVGIVTTDTLPVSRMSGTQIVGSNWLWTRSSNRATTRIFADCKNRFVLSVPYANVFPLLLAGAEDGDAKLPWWSFARSASLRKDASSLVFTDETAHGFPMPSFGYLTVCTSPARLYDQATDADGQIWYPPIPGLPGQSTGYPQAQNPFGWRSLLFTSSTFHVYWLSGLLNIVLIGCICYGVSITFYASVITWRRRRKTCWQCGYPCTAKCPECGWDNPSLIV